MVLPSTSSKSPVLPLRSLGEVPPNAEPFPPISYPSFPLLTWMGCCTWKGPCSQSVPIPKPWGDRAGGGQGAVGINGAKRWGEGGGLTWLVGFHTPSNA